MADAYWLFDGSLGMPQAVYWYLKNEKGIFH
jgi:hypothetical protein